MGAWRQRPHKHSLLRTKSMKDYFGWPFRIAWIISFLGLYALLVRQFGVLAGLSMGWAPAMIGATILAVIWPLSLVAALAFLFINL